MTRVGSAARVVPQLVGIELDAEARAVGQHQLEVLVDERRLADVISQQLGTEQLAAPCLRMHSGLLEHDPVAARALSALLEEGGLATVPAARILGRDPVVRSPHRLATAMAVAAAAQGSALAALHALHGGRQQEVTVRMQDAAHALHPSRYLRQNGHLVDFDYSHMEPGNGFFRTGDGRHCYLISTRPRIRDGILDLLDCPNRKEAIAAALQRWDAPALEDACAGLDLPVTLVLRPQNGPGMRMPWHCEPCRWFPSSASATLLRCGRSIGDGRWRACE